MKLLLFFVLFPLQLFAQDYEGIWKGFLSTAEKNLPYELVIAKNENGYSAYSYIVYDVKGTAMHALKKLKVQVKNGSLFLSDEVLLENNIANASVKEIRQISKLELQNPGSLAGTFRTEGPKNIRQAKGGISLQKMSVEDSIGIKEKLSLLNDEKIAALFEAPTQTQNQTQSDVKKENVVAEKNQDTPMVAVVQKEIEEEKIIPLKGLKGNVLPLKLTVKKPAFNTVSSLALKYSRKANERMAFVQRSTPPQPLPPVVAKATPKPAPPPVPQTVTPSAQKPKEPLLNTLPTANLSGRKIENIESLTMHADSLVLFLYDNGEIDGDIVSVIVNGKILISQQTLGTKPITQTIYLTPDIGDTLQLIMYAENLGDISPNTGLLIIMDGKIRREIRFSGDLQKNAGITLYRKKE